MTKHLHFLGLCRESQPPTLRRLSSLETHGPRNEIFDALVDFAMAHAPSMAGPLGLRIPVHFVEEEGDTMTLQGRVEHGILRKRHKLIALPSNKELAASVVMNAAGEEKFKCFPGELVRVHILHGERPEPGEILCEKDEAVSESIEPGEVEESLVGSPALDGHTASVGETLEVEIQTHTECPVLSKGFVCVVRAHANSMRCTVTEIVQSVETSESGEEVVKSKPMVLKAGQRGVLRLKAEKAAAFEKFETSASLGRVLLLGGEGEQCVAVGAILRYIPLK